MLAYALRVHAAASLTEPACLLPSCCPPALPLPGFPALCTCSIALGEFETVQEAARAYDRAQLLTGGLQASTHNPLSEAFTFAAAACTQGWFSSNQHRPQKQQEDEQPAGSAYHGVLSRGSAWLAMLDIGACGCVWVWGL